jgi:hypothetical protein
MANGELNCSIASVLSECLKRLQSTDGKKRIQDKLRSLSKRSKQVNVHEPLEVKALRLCLPLVTDMLTDVVVGLTDAGGKGQVKDKSNSPMDPNAILIRFLYEAKRQSAVEPQITDLLKQLQAIVQQIIDAVQQL